MSLMQLCIWIQHTHIATAVRTSNWLFPFIETFHIIGLTLVIGSVMWLDFRLLGLSSQASVSEVAHRVLPCTWRGFTLSAFTGILLFSSEAVRCYSNPAFRLKMLMLVMLGINAAVFKFITYRNIQEWDTERATPMGAKMVGVVSLVLWAGVVAAGRWIAYIAEGAR
jgi:hypothetical protein